MAETFLHGVELLEVDSGSRPIRTVRSSVIGMVFSASPYPFDAEGDGKSAFLFSGVGNSALSWFLKKQGAAGNGTLLTVLPKLGNNNPLEVDFSDPRNLKVYLATSATGAVTSTALQIQAFLDPLTACPFKCAPRHALGNGTGVYAFHGPTALAGGLDDSFPVDVPVLMTTPKVSEYYANYYPKFVASLNALYKQGGAVVVAVRTANVVGSAALMTGVYALKKAQVTVGYSPRIMVVEGVTTLGITDAKAVAKSLRAMLVTGPPVGQTATQATAYATANGNDRTYMLWPTVNGGEDPAPYIAGVMAASDNERGFWWSPSNREVFGINSLDSPVDFQNGDASSLANILNEGKVATFIRQGGFRLWGNLTGAIDPKYQFLSVRRTADIINDSIQTNQLWAVDRNITSSYLEDVSGGVNDYLSTLVNLGAIIGGRCWPDPDLNSKDQMALGKVYFNFEFTTPYPAQTVIFRSILTNDYLTEIL